MERSKLALARLRKHWTLAQAAEYIGCDGNTLNRWELGRTMPRGYNAQRLCEVYESAPAELGLDLPHAKVGRPRKSTDQPGASSALSNDLGLDGHLEDAALLPKRSSPNPLMPDDIMIHLPALVVIAHCSSSLDICRFQQRVTQAIESFDTMNTDSTAYQQSRREVLRLLALLPLQGLQLSMRETSSGYPVEDILSHCAAGIVACEYLSAGVDLLLAFSTVSSYLPTLTALVKNSSTHRQEAAYLATQCLLLKTILGAHLEGLPQATQYAQQATLYSEQCSDISLQITALGRLAWIYSCGRQNHLALEQARKAQALFKRGSSLSVSVQSYTYGVLAKYQALNGQQGEALESLHCAHKAFFSHTPETEQEYRYMDHDLSNFLLDDGTTYIFMHNYDEAFRSFAQIIHPETLRSKIPIAERIRVEVLNYQTIAMLKSPRRDMERVLHIWTSAVQAARALQSEQRFSEALTSYEIMEAVWPGEKKIKELRELAVHW